MDPAPDQVSYPALFISDLQDVNNKKFSVNFLNAYSSNIKSHISQKTVEIKVFLNFLLVYGRIRIRSQICTNKLRIRIQETLYSTEIVQSQCYPNFYPFYVKLTT